MTPLAVVEVVEEGDDVLRIRNRDIWDLFAPISHGARQPLILAERQARER